jgi:hypothetical protein
LGCSTREGAPTGSKLFAGGGMDMLGRINEMIAADNLRLGDEYG